MTGDCHVRFRGNAGVKFPCVTRLAAQLTDLGKNREILRELHDDVLKEIQVLADFCKMCNPKKKKR